MNCAVEFFRIFTKKMKQKESSTLSTFLNSLVFIPEDASMHLIGPDCRLYFVLAYMDINMVLKVIPDLT